MTFRNNVVAAYGPWWTNFRASVTLRIVRAPELQGAQSRFPYAAYPAAGLVFRMTSQGYYALLLSSNPKKNQLSVELVRRDFLLDVQRGYTETQIVPWTNAQRLEPSGTNLSVEDSGNQISIFADGQEIRTVDDPKYDQGFVGLIVSGPAHATFKNLVVEQK